MESDVDRAFVGPRQANSVTKSRRLGQQRWSTGGEKQRTFITFNALSASFVMPITEGPRFETNSPITAKASLSTSARGRTNRRRRAAAQ
jgi:hypothetical protein